MRGRVGRLVEARRGLPATDLENARAATIDDDAGVRYGRDDERRRRHTPTRSRGSRLDLGRASGRCGPSRRGTLRHRQPNRPAIWTWRWSMGPEPQPSPDRRWTVPSTGTGAGGRALVSPRMSIESPVRCPSLMVGIGLRPAGGVRPSHGRRADHEPGAEATTATVRYSPPEAFLSNGLRDWSATAATATSKPRMAIAPKVSPCPPERSRSSPSVTGPMPAMV